MTKTKVIVAFPLCGAEKYAENQNGRFKTVFFSYKKYMDIEAEDKKNGKEGTSAPYMFKKELFSTLRSNCYDAVILEDGSVTRLILEDAKIDYVLVHPGDTECAEWQDRADDAGMSEPFVEHMIESWYRKLTEDMDTKSNRCRKVYTVGSSFWVNDKFIETSLDVLSK